MSQQPLDGNQATPIHDAEAVPPEAACPGAPEAEKKGLDAPSETDGAAEAAETAQPSSAECPAAAEGALSATDKEAEAADGGEKTQPPQAENSRKRDSAAAENEELDGAAAKCPRLEEKVRDSTDSTGVDAAVDAAATAQIEKDGVVKAGSANGTGDLADMVLTASQPM
ncbi:uncharacterized protein Tco025E_05445 [Trypanosoma conorhini]|uniref:Uncharacterized protein n=1 Tax=Trypanosoma conorhini TaxID=83891 RepID=A0A3R7KY12_9TRYP|nr:uncharacterized protein Tco025E_05445 [Trypanosoma conorhini]RNF15689.1 hypothetical protein Tco025E_05445 [Trypanosoma conorhini]